MAVPNTQTFTLQDVVNEVNPTTDDLVDCFSDAVAGQFDSAYSGLKNELLNFRNYNAVAANVLTLSKVAGTTSTGAYALVGNYSTTNQTVSYTYEYLSWYNTTTEPIVYLNGVEVTTGVVYTNSNASIAADGGKFFIPFTFGSGTASGTKLRFKFTLYSASVDTVPVVNEVTVIRTIQ